MHHSHVKRKERTMNTKSSTAVRIDPQVVALLQARARKARAQAIGNLMVRLIRKLTPRLDLGVKSAHWG
jgi:hypothetical protein